MAEKRTEEGKLKRKERDRKYYHEVLKINPAYKIKRSQKYYNNYQYHLDYNRRSRLEKNYGLTWEDYQRMYEEQDGKCFLCGGVNEDRLLAVDHDHKTGKVRKLLCGNCNLGLGNFKDNRELLLRAAEYVS